jgi:hypothetical protein
MSTNRECLWDQTYTGTCGGGIGRPAHEVEYVVRDLFASPLVRIRDVRMVVVFALDVFEGFEQAKYYVHVVVRGRPWVRRSQSLLQHTSRYHELTFSEFYGDASAEQARDLYAQLRRYYDRPMEGTGVRYAMFTSKPDCTVGRVVLESRDGVAGFKAPQYVCSGNVRDEVGLGELAGRRKRRYTADEALFVSNSDDDEIIFSHGDEDYEGDDVMIVGSRRRKATRVSFGDFVAQYRTGE